MSEPASDEPADRHGETRSYFGSAGAPVARPDRIGPYRVLAVLGEGGMGTVYLAEQREPVRRRVAVKVVRLGMDSERVLKRFELERQALALMNHDAIARVFDAGTTERGQPYFVMALCVRQLGRSAAARRAVRCIGSLDGIVPDALGPGRDSTQLGALTS